MAKQENVVTVDLLNGAEDENGTTKNVVTVDLLNGAGDDNGTTKPTVNFFSVKPLIVVQGSKAADAIQFYKTVFGAEELKRENHLKRKAEQELPLILCAELKFGSYVFQVCDYVDGSLASPAQVVGGRRFFLHTDNVDVAINNAKEAGAEVKKSAPCGALIGKINDPYGNVWIVCNKRKTPFPTCKRGKPIRQWRAVKA